MPLMRYPQTRVAGLTDSLRARLHRPHNVTSANGAKPLPENFPEGVEHYSQWLWQELQSQTLAESL
jgi:hypothetical protein